MFPYVMGPCIIRGPRGCPGPRGPTGLTGPPGADGTGTSNYKGEYDTSAELIAANPNSVLSDYGYVQETNSFWYYSPTLGTYIYQSVTAGEYMSLPDAVKNEVNFVVVPG